MAAMAWSGGRRVASAGPISITLPIRASTRRAAALDIAQVGGGLAVLSGVLDEACPDDDPPACRVGCGAIRRRSGGTGRRPRRARVDRRVRRWCARGGCPLPKRSHCRAKHDATARCSAAPVRAIQSTASRKSRLSAADRAGVAGLARKKRSDPLPLSPSRLWESRLISNFQP